MKKLTGILFAFSVLLPALVFAGPTYDWAIPENVRIVQPSPVDGMRIFATIQDAIDNIAGSAAADNPYTIKVMAGIYSNTFTLPSYVSLVGSGKESTIVDVPITIAGDTAVEGIKFMSPGQQGTSSPMVTVSDGFNVALRDVAIAVGTESNARALVTGTNSSVKLEGADITVEQNTGNAGNNIDNAIWVGTNGSLEINGSKVKTDFYCNGHGYAFAVYDTKSLVINNSKIESTNLNDSCMLFDGNPLDTLIKDSEIVLDAKNGIMGVDFASKMKVFGSKITANAQDNINEIEVIHCYLCEVTIDNCVVAATKGSHPNELPDPSAVSVMLDGGQVEITNSNITGPVVVTRFSPVVKIGNSKIDGGIDYRGGGTFNYFGCYDGNFQPCQYPTP